MCENKKYGDCRMSDWERSQGWSYHFPALSVGFLFGVFLMGTLWYYDVWDLDGSDAQIQKYAHMNQMCVLGRIDDGKPSGYLGLARPDKGFFSVYTGTIDDCLDIQTTLNVCAHEWAHVCQDLHHLP